MIAGGSASLFGEGPTSVASIGGNLDAGGAAYVGSYGFVTRNVTAAGTVHLDDGGKVGGNVNSEGADYLEYDPNTKTWRPRYAVEVGNPYSSGFAARVDGSVTVRPDQTVAIDTADGASVGLPPIYGTPAAPASVPSITLPMPVTFTADGVDVTNATLPDNGELPPGTYGNVDLDGQTLRLRSGNYYFNDFSSNDLILYLDAGGPTPLEIYVAGSVFAGGTLSTYLTSGSAQDVYVQANQGWDSRLDTGGTFYGTIYSPYGAVSASNLAITGALYSGSTVYIEDVGISRAVIPAPGAVALGAIGLGLVGWLKRRF